MAKHAPSGSRMLFEYDPHRRRSEVGRIAQNDPLIAYAIRKLTLSRTLAVSDESSRARRALGLSPARRCFLGVGQWELPCRNNRVLKAIKRAVKRGTQCRETDVLKYVSKYSLPPFWPCRPSRQNAKVRRQILQLSWPPS